MSSFASLNASRSWELTIFITDLQMQKTIEVGPRTHVGQVMLDLVDKLDVATDWSDHGVWWPDRNCWMLKPRLTLEKYGLTGNASLLFTPIHKMLKLQMPDLQYIDIRVNFGNTVFSSVKEVCTDIGIRHSEEMSFLKLPEIKKKDRKTDSLKKRSSERRSSVGSDETSNLSSGSLENGRISTERQISAGSLGSNLTPGSPKSITSRGASSDFSFGSDPLNPYATPLSPMLANSPVPPTPEAMEVLQTGKTLQERSNINGGWLDSSASLMQQGLKEYDTLLLRFKFFNFFDLNSKIDEVRINQIYHQAKYQILSEEIECTEEEAITFAALQFQAKVASQSPCQNNAEEEEDDIEKAILDLQMSLEGTTATNPMPNKPSLTHIPEMTDTLSLVKKKKLGMHSTKQYWFTFRDTHISYFKNKEESHGTAIEKINLKGCEVIPDVNVSKSKYHIKLRIPGPEMHEVELSCHSDMQYGKWMAACRLASRGKTMADASYDVEVSGVKTFLSMQTNKDKGASDDIDGSTDTSCIQVEDFVPQRLLHKYKSKQIAAKILEAHSSLTKLTLIEAKMSFIRQWKALPEFGVTTFNVKFKGMKTKKPEIFGISPNRMNRMDPISRNILKEWRFSVMQSWNVNWETREMIIQCEDETVVFSCIGYNVKIVHEFIGGCIFLSMRKDVNSPPEEELFFKLTGGWQ